MKANKFVLEHGWDAAKRLVENNEYTGRTLSPSELDLKRLVESHEVVERCNGIEAAKEKLKYFIDWLAEDWTHAEFAPEIGKFKQAIADVESCQ